MSDSIRELLNYDSLREAENITNESYKTDKATEALGFHMHVAHSKIKEDILTKLGDTTLRNTEINYLKIVESIGFKIILKEPFLNDDGITEHFYVMWHDEYSILLKFDTFTWGDDGSWAKAGKEVPEPSINGGYFYYNVKINEGVTRNCTSSGHYEDGIWVGYHDCREAIKFKVSELAKNSQFQKQWIERPYMSLVNRSERDGNYDNEKITEEKISKFPQYIIDAITPKTK